MRVSLEFLHSVAFTEQRKKLIMDTNKFLIFDPQRYIVSRLILIHRVEVFEYRIENLD